MVSTVGTEARVSSSAGHGSVEGRNFFKDARKAIAACNKSGASGKRVIVWKEVLARMNEDSSGKYEELSVESLRTKYRAIHDVRKRRQQ